MDAPGSDSSPVGASLPAAGRLSSRPAVDPCFEVASFHDRYLNFEAAEALRDVLHQLLSNAAERKLSGVVLRLSEVGGIDSCGVGLLIQACNIATSLGLAIGLYGVAPFLDRILEIMRLKRYLQVFDSEEEAVRYLS